VFVNIKEGKGMNREIKFRAWDKINEVMCDVNSIDFDVNQVYLGAPAVGMISFDDVELLQFTGLKDKNGKEIYENDIVKSEDNRNYLIEFNGGSFGVFINKGRTFSPLVINELFLSCEIIGNIYEHKHLLNNN
jgi:hypothetical protein